MSGDPRFLYPDEVDRDDSEKVAQLLEESKNAVLILLYDEEEETEPRAVLMLHDPESNKTFRTMMDRDRILAFIGQLAAAAGLGVMMMSAEEENGQGYQGQEVARDG